MLGDGIGDLITEEGRFSIRTFVVASEGHQRGVKSQGFEIVRAGAKARITFTPKPSVEKTTAKIWSVEEVILEEIRRFAKNNPMRLIGLILMKVSTGVRFQEIGPIELLDWAEEFGLKTSLAETRRVMEKIKASELGQKLLAGERVGLNKAYKMYR